MDAKPTFDFDADTRGVSEVIGSILVFGLVVLLLTILQTQAVPSANEQVEFEHSMEVQQDVSKLSSAVSQAATGQGTTATVATGTGYPNRLVLFNPPPATGSLRSTDGGEVRLENFQAVDPEARDYLAGGSGANAFSFGDTHGFVYEPNYNRYRSAPVTGYEHGVVYDDPPEGDVTVENGGTLVSGRTISLTLLSGGLSASGQRTVTVDAVPVSGPRSTAQVVPDGGPLTVTVPTRLPEEVWVTEILAGQIDDTGDGNPALEDGDTTCGDITSATTDGDGRYVTGCTYGGDTITLEFQETENGEPVRYGLRTARVGFSGAASVTASNLDDYVVNVSPVQTSADPGETVDLRVEVRDEYNNPVAGAQVKAFIDESGTGGTESVERSARTDEDGVAVVTYTAPSSGSPFTGEDRDVIVTTDRSASNRQQARNAPPEDRVTFTVSVSGGSGGGLGGAITGPPQIHFVDGSFDTAGPGSKTTGIQFDLTNDGGLVNSPEVVAVEVASTSTDATQLLETVPDSGSGVGGITTYDYRYEVAAVEQGTPGVTFDSYINAPDGGPESLDITSGRLEFSSTNGDGNFTLGAGETTRFYLYEFQRSDNSAVDMDGSIVTVRVYYRYDSQLYFVEKSTAVPEPTSSP